MTVLSNTGVFEKFPAAVSQPSDSGRRALTALGHFAALVVAVAGIAVTTVGSIMEIDNPLTGRPAAFTAYVTAVLVAVGIVRSSFGYTLRGFAFAGGFIATMAVGQYVFGDAVYFGWIYLGFAALMAFVAGVVWLDVRLNGRPC